MNLRVDYTYSAKLCEGIDIMIFLFNLFTKSYSLFYFLNINFDWPTTFNMIYPSAFSFKPFCINLHRKETRKMVLIVQRNIELTSQSFICISTA